MQTNLFETPQDPNLPIQIENGEYIYIPHFYNRQKADKYLTILGNNIDWKQESMNMYGKQVLFPRLTAWYGDNDKPYSFSGITLNPNPWSAELFEIRRTIEQRVQTELGFYKMLLKRDFQLAFQAKCHS